MNYNSPVMRALACVLLIPFCVMTQSSPSPKPFPIPENMHETWLGAGLNDAETKLLLKALWADRFDPKADRATKLSLDSIDMAGVSLGKLGKGVLVLMSGSSSCGNANCPIYVYTREEHTYREIRFDKSKKRIMQPYGWAFGVVDSKAEVPDLVFASNEGGPQVGLYLYSYVGDIFVLQACETLTKKDLESGASWWDPSAVAVEPRPCGGN